MSDSTNDTASSKTSVQSQQAQLPTNAGDHSTNQSASRLRAEIDAHPSIPDDAVPFNLEAVKKSSSDTWSRALEIDDPAADTGREDVFLTTGTDDILQNTSIHVIEESDQYIGWCSCPFFTAEDSPDDACEHLTAIGQLHAIGSLSAPSVTL